jgi:hypothetical protein
MRTTKTLLATTLVVAGLLAAVASGGAPMGSPTAQLGEGKWGWGVEYGYEQMDLEASGKVTDQSIPFFWSQDFKIEDLASNLLFGSLSYGICDTWDIFVRVGAADASDDIILSPADSTAAERRDAFDGDFGVAWGVGTRGTFCRSGPWSVGGVMQVTWFRPGDSDFSIVDPFLPDETWVGQVDLEYWQAQFGLAAALQSGIWRVWAGPFLQFVGGDMDFDGTAIIGDSSAGLKWSSDIRQSSEIGAFAGMSWAFTDSFNLRVEGQVTEDSFLLSAGVLFIPGRTSEF